MSCAHSRRLPGLLLQLQQLQRLRLSGSNVHQLWPGQLAALATHAHQVRLAPPHSRLL